MKKQATKTVLFLILTCEFPPLFGHQLSSKVMRRGEIVHITLRDRRELSGELLVARDTTLLMAARTLTLDQDEKISSNDVVVLNRQEIQKIFVQGKSKTLSGMAWGTGVGLAIGGAVYLNRQKESYADLIPVLWGITGFVVGTVLGMNSTTSDKTIEIIENMNLNSLKSISRFPMEEPHHLKSIY